MNKSEIYSEIFEEYSKEKREAEKSAEQLKDKLYNKIPRLREIENEISLKGVELFKSAVSGGDLQKFEEFKNTCNKLKQERQNILKRLGMTENALEPQYKCKTCKDTGMVDNKKCKCFNKRIAEKYYQLSNIGTVLNKENFNNFNYNLFSKNILEDGLSPYENIKNISREALFSVENIDNAPLNMLFYGHSGLGKTFMCNCIAKALMDRGYFVIYMSAYKLFTTMTKVRFNNATEAEIENARLPEECDLLVIDDLGTEGVNSSTVPEFFDILNTRLRANKSILISTNLDLPDIGVIYSERVLSRILGNFKVFKFIGNDLRMH
ncbi:MAG: ATP-binding protein [Clostridia bacterium]|nr:ATP-binding protein [Clostridia bacterium]